MSKGKTKKTLGMWGVLRLGLFLGITIAAGIGANLWKQDLRVGTVRVEGNAIVLTEEILSRAAVSAGSRLFAIDLDAVEKRVMQNRFIKSVRINREVPDQLLITVEERTPVAAVADGALKYIDEDGVILPAVHSEHVIDLPLFTGLSLKKGLSPGTPVDDSAIKEMLEIVLTARMINDDLYRNISEIHYAADGFVLFTADCGVPVLFGEGEAARKLVTMDGFWKHIVQPVGGHMLEYIDVRFEDQVVCRWKKEVASANEGGRITGLRGSVRPGEQEHSSHS